MTDSKERRNGLWKRFACNRCGICCTGIDLPYDPKSIFEIAEYFGLSVKQVVEKYYGKLTENGKGIIFEEHK